MPYIKVCLERKGDKCLRLEFEHPELVLSYLVPGRVTYRYDSYGNLIPIRGSLRGSYLFTDLSEYIKTDERKYDVCRGDKIAEELLCVIRVINKSAGSSASVKCYKLGEVFLERFRDWDNPREFGRFGYSSKRRTMYDLEGFLRKVSASSVLQVSHRTVAYPRLESVWEAITQRKSRIEDIYIPGLYLELNEMDVVRYTYAEDVRIHARRMLRGERKPYLEESDLRIPRGKTPRGAPEVRQRVTEIRELRLLCYQPGTRERGCEEPSVIGYQIKRTTGLLLQVTRTGLTSSLLRKLLEETKEWLKTRDLSSPNAYTALSVCQVLRNAIAYILTEDLHLKSYWSTLQHKVPLDTLMRTALLLYEVLNGDLCSTLLEGGVEALGAALRKSMRELLKSYSKSGGSSSGERVFDSRTLVIITVVGGRESILRKISALKYEDIESFIDEAVERIRNFGNTSTRGGSPTPDDIALNLLNLVLAHTYSHHLLKHASLRSGVLGAFLKEGLRFLTNSRGVELLLFEGANGGVGAFETTFKYWESGEGLSRQSRLEELLLKLGECAIGFSEDLLYYGKGVVQVHVTPQELEEFRRLESSFKEEVRRLAKIWGVHESKLSTEIIELVRSSDRRFARFADLDEILLHLLETVDLQESALGELITKVLARCLRVSSNEARDRLVQIKSSLRGRREVGEDRIGEFAEDLRRILSILKSVLVRLIPRSCNTACPSCYYNQYVCTYTNPSAQLLLLNRRLLKLVAAKTITTSITRPGLEVVEVDDGFLKELPRRSKAEAGALVEVGGRLYWVKHEAEAS